MAEVDATTMSAWEASASTWVATAARLARDLRGDRPGLPVSSSSALAPRYGVGLSTVDKARRLLRQYGVIAKASGQYYTT